MCCYIDSLHKFKYLYFRTLPFDVFVQRAAEVKHKEYFISEVISLVSVSSVGYFASIWRGK